MDYTLFCSTGSSVKVISKIGIVADLVQTSIDPRNPTDGM